MLYDTWLQKKQSPKPQLSKPQFQNHNTDPRSGDRDNAIPDQLIPDPWAEDHSSQAATSPAPPEFIRKIEAKIKHDAEHLVGPATPSVPQISAPATASELRADLVLLQDELKIPRSRRSRLATAVSRALALLWWSENKPRE